MANEMDELLSELKAEYQSEKRKPAEGRDPKPTRAKSQSTPPPATPSPADDAAESAMFDELLADVKTEAEREEPRPTARKAGDCPSDASRANRSNSASDRTQPSNHHQFYEQLKQQQQARERAAQKQQEEQQREAEIAAKKKAEHRALRRRAALTEKARHWLQNLDLNSEEGKWFEEFSYSYDSQLEAAVDYLEAMRESGL